MLCNNIAVNERIDIDSSNIIIDLNGHAITRGLVQSQSVDVTDYGSVFCIFGGGALTLDDTSAKHNGTVTGGNSKQAGGGVRVMDGTLILKNGSISNNRTDGEGGGGGGVYLGDNDSRFYMYGGTISKNHGSDYGGGLYIDRGKAIIYDGNFNHNGAFYRGGAIYVNRMVSDALTIYGGTFNNNYASVSNSTYVLAAGGGAIYIYDGGAYIANAAFRDNDTDERGGAVYCDSSIGTTIHNCTFGNNRSKKDGSAIFVDTDNVVLDSITVTGNKCSADGEGAVYLRANDVLLKGKVIIRDNYIWTVHGGWNNTTPNQYESQKNADLYLGWQGTHKARLYLTKDLNPGSDIYMFGEMYWVDSEVVYTEEYNDIESIAKPSNNIMYFHWSDSKKRWLGAYDTKSCIQVDETNSERPTISIENTSDTAAMVTITPAREGCPTYYKIDDEAWSLLSTKGQVYLQGGVDDATRTISAYTTLRDGYCSMFASDTVTLAARSRQVDVEGGTIDLTGCKESYYLNSEHTSAKMYFGEDFKVTADKIKGYYRDGWSIDGASESTFKSDTSADTVSCRLWEGYLTGTDRSDVVTITANQVAKANYSVQFNVEGGTFSDGTTSQMVHVKAGEKLDPDQVPTGMVADYGYDKNFGAWVGGYINITEVLDDDVIYTYRFDKLEAPAAPYIYAVNEGGRTSVSIYPTGKFRSHLSLLTAYYKIDDGEWTKGTTIDFDEMPDGSTKRIQAKLVYPYSYQGFDQTRESEVSTKDVKIESTGGIKVYAEDATLSFPDWYSDKPLYENNTQAISSYYSRIFATANVPDDMVHVGWKAVAVNADNTVGTETEIEPSSVSEDGLTATYSLSKADSVTITSIQEPLHPTITFKVVNGTFSDGTTERTTTVNHGKGLSEEQVPTDLVPGYTFENGSWDVDFTETYNNNATVTFTFETATAPASPSVHVEEVDNGSSVAFWVNAPEGETRDIDLYYQVDNGEWTLYENPVQLVNEHILKGTFSAKAVFNGVDSEATSFSFAAARVWPITFVIKNGTWANGSSKPITVKVEDGQTLRAIDVPTNMIPDVDGAEGHWSVDVDTNKAWTSEFTYTYTFATSSSDDGDGTDEVDYQMESESDQVETGEDAVFTGNGGYSKLMGVLVDGVEVSSKVYEVARVSGCASVTLTAAYTAELAAGEHTIALVYTDGQAAGSFTVKEPAADSGDSASETGAASLKSVVLSKTKCTYTGKALKPAVTVKDTDGKVLKKDTDYTVTYKNNKNVGSATVTVKGMGNYSGTLTKTFKIVPKSTKVYKPKAGKKSATVKWKKVAKVTGYQISYSTSKKFTKKTTKTKKVKGAKKVSGKLAKLKAGKRHYVKVRAYTVVDGKTYYSAWSKAKTVTAKK